MIYQYSSKRCNRGTSFSLVSREAGVNAPQLIVKTGPEVFLGSLPTEFSKIIRCKMVA
jgi:hypothetical protein